MKKILALVLGTLMILVLVCACGGDSGSEASVVGAWKEVDGEGIILLYDKSEAMLKKMATTFLYQITEAVCGVIGSQIVVKTAFLEEIEDNLIDFWNLGPAIPQGDMAQDTVDALADRFPELVEMTDSSEFLEYNPEDDNFSQEEISEDSDREEFLEDNEMMSDDE